MNKFEIGEIAIYIDDGHPLNRKEILKYDGDDVEITGFRESKRWGLFAKVIWPCGAHGEVTINCLRKKQPPQELGSWDAEVFKDLNWNPTKEHSDAH